MGFKSVEAAVKAIKGENVDKCIDTNIKIINQKNMKEKDDKLIRWLRKC